jgi:hypothetical protein
LIFAKRSWWDTYSHVLTASGPLPSPAGSGLSCSSKRREKNRKHQGDRGTIARWNLGRSARLVRAMVPSVATGRMERPGRQHGRRAMDGGGWPRFAVLSRLSEVRDSEFRIGSLGDCLPSRDFTSEFPIENAVQAKRGNLRAILGPCSSGSLAFCSFVAPPLKTRPRAGALRPER